MARTLSGASFDRNEYVLQPQNGGSGCVSAQEIKDRYNLVNENEINVPGGIVGYDENGKFPAYLLQEGGGSTDGGISISGATVVGAGTTVQYNIVNYDAAATYTISFDKGVATREGKVITIVFNDEISSSVLTINSSTFIINIVSAVPQTPVVQISGLATLTGATLYITADAYVSPFGTEHASTDWLIASDEEFTNVLFTGNTDTVNKTTLTKDVDTFTTYYVKALFRDQVGRVSVWSTAGSVNRASLSNSISTPTMSVTGGKTTAGVTLTVNSSVLLAAAEAVHAHTYWEVATDVSFTNIVYTSGIDVVDKTSKSIEVNVIADSYYVRCKYVTVSNDSSSWGVSNAINRSTLFFSTPSFEEAKIVHNDAADQDNFGRAVSISNDGTRVVVGALGKSISGGAAYIFSRSGTTWTQEAKIVYTAPVNGGIFGYSVSISGDGTRVVVGAPNKVETYINQGALYVFSRTGTTWTQEAKLLHTDPVYNEQFGSTVSISNDGTRVIAGFLNLTTGAAYIFLRTGTTWTQEAKIVNSDLANNDYFGYSVSISSDGTRVAVGARYKTGTAGASQGAAYIFLRTGTTWSQESKIVHSDPASNDLFGTSVAISGDGTRVVVGASNKNTSTGAAYIFLRTGSTWTQEAKLVQGISITNGCFGYSVSISNDGSRAVIGTPQLEGNAAGRSGTSYIFSRSGTMWTQDAKLLASDSSGDDYFGWSVAISGDGARLIAGAYTKNSVTGAAYIFAPQSYQYQKQTKVVHNDPASDDQFGISVSISSDGSRVVVGVRNKNSYTGAAYIFSRTGSTWTQEAKIIHNDPASSDLFGYSVSISNDGSRVVVGAYYKNNATGAAYIFLRSGTTWSQEAKIVHNDPASDDQFGISVSISSDGSRVVVGVRNKNSYTGAAYIFSRTGSTWTQEAKIIHNDPASSDLFGYSVSISSDGSRVVVGAHNKNGSTGAAYIFLRTGTTWSQEAKIVHNDPASDDRFGWSVSISSDGSRVIIGAYTKNSYKGAAYIFSRTGSTWSQEAKIVYNDPANNDYFGYSVSISSDGSRVVVGAYYKNSTTGAAYIFLRTGSTWSQEAKIVHSDPASSDYFGNAVSISSDGTRVVVGAYIKNSTTGAAYIFE